MPQQQRIAVTQMAFNAYHSVPRWEGHPSPATFERLNSKVLLLAESDEALREELASQFSKEGYRVIEVEDGMELLDYFEDPFPMTVHAKPDLIVAEVAMEGFGGLEACARLRDLEWKIPVVLISDHYYPETDECAEELGVKYLFTRPLDFDNLLAAVAALLGGT